MTMAPDTTKTATTVFQCIGIPKTARLKMAVRISSTAETNVLRTELKVRMKSEVIIPINALVNIMAITSELNPSKMEYMLKYR